jgi:biotin transport system substrate-specific component
MKINTKQMILTGLFAALTAVGAFIQIPIGTVPITLQLLFTVLAGVMLGSKLGALSQLVYVLIGLFGVPILAGGTGGFSSVLSPSFGYLIGFILCAYVVGKLTEGNKKPSFAGLLFASFIGVMVVYLIGVPYLYLIVKNLMGKDMTFAAALKTGFFIFIPGDLLKCAVASVLGVKVVPAVQKSAAY